MDTVIVKYHSNPTPLDSITVKADYSLIAAKLDSIREQSYRNFEKLNNTIITSSQKTTREILWQGFASSLPLFLFLFGILFEYLRSRCKDFKQKQETREVTSYHLNRIISGYITKLIDSYRAISTDTKIDTGINLTPPELSSNDFQRFLNMNLDSVILAVDEQLSLYEIVSRVEFINNQFDRVKQYHSISLKENGRVKSLIESKRKAFSELLYSFISTDREILNPQHPSPEAIRTNEILGEYNNQASDENRIELLKTILCQQVITFFEGNLKLFDGNNLVNEIIEAGKELVLSVELLERRNEEFKKQYGEFAEETERAHKTIIRETEKIKWTKDYPWYCFKRK